MVAKNSIKETLFCLYYHFLCFERKYILLHLLICDPDKVPILLEHRGGPSSFPGSFQCEVNFPVKQAFESSALGIFEEFTHEVLSMFDSLSGCPCPCLSMSSFCWNIVGVDVLVAEYKTASTCQNGFPAVPAAVCQFVIQHHF